MDWEEGASHLLALFFVLAFLASIIMTWHVMLVKRDFAIFTDPDTIPEPTDFFQKLPEFLKNL